MLKKLGQFVLNSNLFLAVSAFVFVAGVNKDYSRNLNYSVGVFFAILGVYNFHRLIKLRQGKLQVNILIWTEQHSTFLWISSVLGLVLSVVFLAPQFAEKLNILGVFAVLFLISISYVVLKIREIPLIKAVLIAFCWMMVATVIPDYSHSSLETHSFFSFFLFLGLTIPADIKDLNFDSKSLKTIPQIIGINAAIVVSFVFVSAFIFLQNPALNLTFSVQLFGLFWMLLTYIFYFRNTNFRIELVDGILLIFGLSFWLN
jgi:hypothetical protein